MPGCYEYDYLIPRTPLGIQAARGLHDHTLVVMDKCFDCIIVEFFPKDLPDKRLVCKHYTESINGKPLGFVLHGDIYLPEVKGLHVLRFQD
jgi:hypothetical protein